MTARRDWLQRSYVPAKKKRRPKSPPISESWLARTGAFNGDPVAIKRHLDRLLRLSK